MHSVLTAVAFLSVAFAQPAVFVCPGVPGTASSYEGTVTGLLNPETYVAVLEISPDGGTFWDKTCGYPFHYECGANAATSGTVLLGNAQGERGHGFPVNAQGRFNISNWATTLPEDVNAHFLQVFIIPKNTLEQTPYFLYAHGEGEQIDPAVLASTLHSAVIDKTLPLNPICASLSPSSSPSASSTPSAAAASASNSPTKAPASLAFDVDPLAATTYTVTVTVTEVASASPDGKQQLTSGATMKSTAAVVVIAITAVAAAFGLGG